MVASSVVSTILILNYHHRSADTHEMSEWVSVDPEFQDTFDADGNMLNFCAKCPFALLFGAFRRYG